MICNQNLYFLSSLFSDFLSTINRKRTSGYMAIMHTHSHSHYTLILILPPLSLSLSLSLSFFLSNTLKHKHNLSLYTYISHIHLPFTYWTSAVNFTKNLKYAFSPIFISTKHIQTRRVNSKNLCITLLYKKRCSKNDDKIDTRG
jgi:hypothetical protein